MGSLLLDQAGLPDTEHPGEAFRWMIDNPPGKAHRWILARDGQLDHSAFLRIAQNFCAGAGGDSQRGKTLVQVVLPEVCEGIQGLLSPRSACHWNPNLLLVCHDFVRDMSQSD